MDKRSQQDEAQEPTRSLSEIYESVVVPRKAKWWRRWFVFAGPALMAAVGYMDPGNWATDLAAGSRYNYTLIWVLLMSNLMAILLQSLAARLGIAARRDLAQACREEYPPAVNLPLYGLAEIAITATDLAEVLGSAIALQLLFGMPLIYGVLLTALDTLLLLALTRFGIRKLEAVVLALVATIGVAFMVEIFLAQPDWGGIVRGFVPSMPDSTALYISVGILGATVMPHNLYLHSALVQTRRVGRTRGEIKEAIKWNTIDSAVSLNIAFLVNAAILVMAASVFYRHGLHEVAEIGDAHRLLEPLLGASVAPVVFAIALLASGQSSTITGTLAGQIVMEGYLNLRIRPWLRRLMTRLMAVVPAIAVIAWYGEDSTGGLLVLSQVILSLQLPFAVIPLVNFARDKRRMGEFAINRWIYALALLVAAVIIVLNVNLVIEEVGRWTERYADRGWIITATVVPVVVALGGLLLYIVFRPWLVKIPALRLGEARIAAIHPSGMPAINVLQLEPYKHIAVALDLDGGEENLLAEALRLSSVDITEISLLHVVESPVARIVGRDAADHEVEADEVRLEELATALRYAGIETECHLGAGDTVNELVRLVNELDVDLTILGGHGHAGIADLLHGTTVDRVRHRVKGNVLVVPTAKPTTPKA